MLPAIDFELAYWRLRRRTDRLRGAWRAYASHARAAAHMSYLYHFGRLPQAPQPEDTTLYRALWAAVIVGLAGVLTLEAVGTEQLFGVFANLVI
jgi:hypothetical protein